jgi:hypothetical protein
MLKVSTSRRIAVQDQHEVGRMFRRPHYQPTNTWMRWGTPVISAVQEEHIGGSHSRLAWEYM